MKLILKTIFKFTTVCLFIFYTIVKVNAKIDSEITPSVLPPKIIYHFGRTEYLLEDIALQNIPKKVWDESIMGDKGRFSLKPFRRGLYGTDHIAHADYYGTRMAYESKNLPYFMAITIKNSCLKKEAVMGNFFEMDSDPRFKKWFTRQSKSSLKNLTEFSEACLKGKEDEYGEPIKILEMVHSTLPESECEKIIQKFLNDEKIKLVLDAEWEHSWAIRDRNCIEKIDGAPKDILKLLSKNPGSFLSEPKKGEVREGSFYYPKGFGTLLTLLQALGSTVKIDKNFEAVYLELTKSDLNESLVSSVGMRAMESVERCLTLKNTMEYETELKSFLTLRTQNGSQNIEDLQLSLNAFKERLNLICRSF